MSERRGVFTIILWTNQLVDITQLDPLGLQPVLIQHNWYSFGYKSILFEGDGVGVVPISWGREKLQIKETSHRMCSLGSENVPLTAASIPGGLKVSI